MEPFVFINDVFLEPGKAALLVQDLAIQRGYGIFDFFKTLNGKPVFLDEHLNRFYSSATQMRLPVHKTPQELKELLWQVMDRNNLANSGIRITLTGGYAPDGYSISA